MPAFQQVSISAYCSGWSTNGRLRQVDTDAKCFGTRIGSMRHAANHARMPCSLLDQLRSGRWPPQDGVSFPGPMGLTYASFGITRAGQAEDRALYLEPRKVRDPGREAVYVYPYGIPLPSTSITMSCSPPPSTS